MSVLILTMLLEMFLNVWNAPPASLGELARREAVRRHAVAAAVKSMTAADLGPAPERPPKPVPPPSTTEETAKAGEKAAEPPKDEKWWRARITAARAALERDKLLHAALENRIATLTRDSVNRDDPAQRAVLINERLRALQELELLKKQLIADADAIAAIEEEARQAGIPPGWIRGD